MSLRLTHPKIKASGRLVQFSFDGQEYQGVEGETIAAALAANGVRALRENQHGQHRGIYCGMGACQECLVTIDGRISQRACITKVEDGQVISSAAPTSCDMDKDAGSAHSLLRPLTPVAQKAIERRSSDVLVIGAGPAGLSAALTARRRGASVVVLDERPQSGGQFFKPLAPSQQSSRPIDRQFADGKALTAGVIASGVVIHQNAQVWAAFSPTEIGAVIDGGAVVLECRQLIIATGAYERPAPFPGWTLPGVMTTGAAQTLARAYRVSPGQRVLVAGNGPLNLQLANELLAGGAEVVAVLESAPKPSFAKWRDALRAARNGLDLIVDGMAYLARLRLRGVPVLWGSTVTAAEGDVRDGLRLVRTAKIDEAGHPVAGTEQTFEVDALCVGYGFIPSTELPRMLGCDHRFVDAHLGYLATVTDQNGATNIPGVFVVGDGADIGGSRVALARGALAGEAAAKKLGLATVESKDVQQKLHRALDFQQALRALFLAPAVDLTQVPDDTVLCRCENVTFGAVRAQLAMGHDTLATIKRNTRLGMGRCQARYCANVAARLVHQETQRANTVDQYFAPRAPVRPVPVSALCLEKPEWGGHRPAITPNLARPVEVTPLGEQSVDLLVIGGGVLGANLAYFLSQHRQDVMVVERDDLNLQASGANAGSLHVQLLSFDFGAKGTTGRRTRRGNAAARPHVGQVVATDSE